MFVLVAMSQEKAWGQAKAEIYAIILQEGEVTARDIYTQNDMSRPFASKTLRKMFENGLLQREMDPDANDGPGSPPYVYWIRDDVKEEYPTAKDFARELVSGHMERLLGGFQENGLEQV